MPLAADFCGRTWAHARAHAQAQINTRKLKFSEDWLLLELRHTLQLADPHNNRF
jgi:hypothetical protein